MSSAEMADGAAAAGEEGVAATGSAVHVATPPAPPSDAQEKGQKAVLTADQAGLGGGGGGGVLSVAAAPATVAAGGSAALSTASKVDSATESARGNGESATPQSLPGANNGSSSSSSSSSSTSPPKVAFDASTQRGGEQLVIQDAVSLSSLAAGSVASVADGGGGSVSFDAPAVEGGVGGTGEAKASLPANTNNLSPTRRGAGADAMAGRPLSRPVSLANAISATAHQLLGRAAERERGREAGAGGGPGSPSLSPHGAPAAGSTPGGSKRGGASGAGGGGASSGGNGNKTLKNFLRGEGAPSSAPAAIPVPLFTRSFTEGRILGMTGLRHPPAGSGWGEGGGEGGGEGQVSPPDAAGVADVSGGAGQQLALLKPKRHKQHFGKSKEEPEVIWSDQVDLPNASGIEISNYSLTIWDKDKHKHRDKDKDKDKEKDKDKDRHQQQQEEGGEGGAGEEGAEGEGGGDSAAEGKTAEGKGKGSGSDQQGGGDGPLTDGEGVGGEGREGGHRSGEEKEGAAGGAAGLSTTRPEGGQAVEERTARRERHRRSRSSGVGKDGHKLRKSSKGRRGKGRKKIPKPKPKTKRDVRFGKEMQPGSGGVEYELSLGMMLGLRVAVGRQPRPTEDKTLLMENFYQCDKYLFPPAGSAQGPLRTPSHNLTHKFKFKDYSAKVFKRIREHFGVDRLGYMLSVAGDYNFLKFISNAKSGEFFFFSHDERFLIKTMSSAEVKFFRRILPHYYEHVKTNPDTFLVRFYGMYRVKMHHIHRQVHFIVMNSVLDTPKDIHHTFDLKGSTYGRVTPKDSKVRKDLNFIEEGRKLHLGPQRDAFLHIMRKDALFLASMKIMDYSLLVGIHDRQAGQAGGGNGGEEQASPHPGGEEGGGSGGKGPAVLQDLGLLGGDDDDDDDEEEEEEEEEQFRGRGTRRRRGRRRAATGRGAAVGGTAAAEGKDEEESFRVEGGDADMSSVSPGGNGGGASAAEGTGESEGESLRHHAVTSGEGEGDGYNSISNSDGEGEAEASDLEVSESDYPSGSGGHEQEGLGGSHMGGSHLGGSHMGGRIAHRRGNGSSASARGATGSHMGNSMNNTGLSELVQMRHLRASQRHSQRQTAAEQQNLQYMAGGISFQQQRGEQGGEDAGHGEPHSTRDRDRRGSASLHSGMGRARAGSQSHMGGGSQAGGASLGQGGNVFGSGLGLSGSGRHYYMGRRQDQAYGSIRRRKDQGLESYRPCETETADPEGEGEKGGEKGGGTAAGGTAPAPGSGGGGRRGGGEEKQEGHRKRVMWKKSNEIYFCGVIDILQQYNVQKHGETFFKSLIAPKAHISCVDPLSYAKRFCDFLEENTE